MRDVADSIPRTVQGQAFWGMAPLYQEIARAGAGFFYVSAAPAELMGSLHAGFLKRSGFPTGSLRLPSIWRRENFKIREILRTLLSERPEFVLFIGDNGEKDPAIYATVIEQLEAAGVRFQSLTLIRQTYSKKTGAQSLRTGQIPFVTAAEIALQLQARGRGLSEEGLRRILNLSAERPGWFWRWLEKIRPGSLLGLPLWNDCRDHHLVWPEMAEGSPQLQKLEGRIRSRCALSEPNDVRSLITPPSVAP